MQHCSHQTLNSTFGTVVSTFFFTWCPLVFHSLHPLAFESVIQPLCCNRPGAGILPVGRSIRVLQPVRADFPHRSGLEQIESASGTSDSARRDTIWCQLWANEKFA